MSTRKQILEDLAVGLETDIDSVKKATDFLLSSTRAINSTPYIGVWVDSEEPLSPGSNRYRTELVLQVLTEQSYVGIEDLIEDIKAYLKTADIDNALELDYLGHDPVPKNDIEESDKISGTNIRVSLIYKDTNDDTIANQHPSTTPTGYMAIAHYKTYALMVSGSTTFQSAGTFVYNSHKNANLEIPADSGSISVDLVDAPVVEFFGGRADSIHVDDNAVQISIRAHFAKGITNTVIAPFMWSIVDEVRKNVNLGDDYKMVHADFVPTFNQTFDESATTGAELLYSIHKAQDYTQI